MSDNQIEADPTIEEQLAFYQRKCSEQEDELLALRTRDVGDDEVEKLFVNAMHAIGVDESVNPEGCRSSQRSLEELHHLAITRGQQLREAREENTRLEQDLARLKVEYADLESRFDSINKACDIFEKNSKAAADLCDENWKLKAEIERLKNEMETLVGEAEERANERGKQIATLTAERDEAEKEAETLKADDKINAAMSDRCNRVMRVLRDSGNADAESAFWIIAGDARDSRETIARLTKELAALKSCPAMEEVDAALAYYRGNYHRGVSLQCVTKLADIARRAIAAREEVVGLLKWLDEFWDFKEVKKCLCEYASDKVYGDDQKNARRIIEIVEGK